MKKLFSVFITVIFMLCLCSSLFAAEIIIEPSADSTAATADFKFDHKIVIVCPWGEGGGADSTLR
ncbi:MAG: hypothetical protein IJP96_02050, partial [Synergistaceae bacterium]|nr:hypothetical protein [Synergistaceae bacterium]